MNCNSLVSMTLSFYWVWSMGITREKRAEVGEVGSLPGGVWLISLCILL